MKESIINTALAFLALSITFYIATLAYRRFGYRDSRASFNSVPKLLALGLLLAIALVGFAAHEGVI